MFKLIVLTFAALPMMSSSLQRKLLGDDDGSGDDDDMKWVPDIHNHQGPIRGDTATVMARIEERMKQRMEKRRKQKAGQAVRQPSDIGHTVKPATETPAAKASRREMAIKWAKDVESAAKQDEVDESKPHVLATSSTANMTPPSPLDEVKAQRKEEQVEMVQVQPHSLTSSTSKANALPVFILLIVLLFVQ